MRSVLRLRTHKLTSTHMRFYTVITYLHHEIQTFSVYDRIVFVFWHVGACVLQADDGTVQRTATLVQERHPFTHTHVCLLPYDPPSRTKRLAQSRVLLVKFPVI